MTQRHALAYSPSYLNGRFDLYHSTTLLDKMHTQAIMTLAALLAPLALALPANYDHKSEGSKDYPTSGGLNIFDFSSTYSAYATPGMVVNANNSYTGGQEGSSGEFHFGINARQNVICYNITVYLAPNSTYQSPARTATHIHQGTVGLAGPPRLTFPNPVLDDSGYGQSIGCLQGPFETGVLSNGTDTAANFTVAAIERSPSSFFADTHTSDAVPGAVRGQLTLTGTIY
ncbi:uncharacterized protein L969DRAFT_93042 [Mixia osmundae IAM 14324]|uniref:CHRD domain-containing protein n=1 Tax=Mixia osmundae (strain CBS 9802 / IAM 14324 / JCM 22182 / KY 12970) TaxID=764103 RepID=G7E6A0_MIXOS|nr:uncharacterized protein L969DRAFT_93042 [Mixia osmundae IAM 14324]KEI40483.1 hypothetical protein L969DRAFT_93042 [Mixia osmundae IAM 14324]GAA98360.1 hypothetical protein E5Q_05046 [Mixia osmundae IAM 14324]